MMIDFLNKVFPYFFLFFSASLLKITIFHEILFFVFEMKKNPELIRNLKGIGTAVVK